MANVIDAASDILGKGMEAASDLLEKGKDAAGDLATSAGVLAEKTKVKAKLYDQGLEYDRLMRKLGTALYGQLKDDPTYADANKSLFDEIAACVERRQNLEDELSEIDARAAAAKPIDVEALEAGDEPEAEGDGTEAGEAEGDGADDADSDVEDAEAEADDADDAEAEADDADDAEADDKAKE